MPDGEQTAAPPAPPKPDAPPARVVRPPLTRRQIAILTGAGLAALLLVFVVVPWLYRSLTTVSTDDAYVSGHVTFVAARVPGQVARVLVDDNNRVRKGDLLVQLDKEPYEVRVGIAQAAVSAAQATFDATL